MRNLSIIFIILLSTVNVYSASVRISQIDSSSLLIDQTVKLYISVIEGQKPVKDLKQTDFKVFEAADKDGLNFRETQITDFKTGTNYQEGINFLLLIDNSGSMYLSLDGRKTADPSATRIAAAKRVVAAFLKTITNPKDKVGIASFHGYYRNFSDPVADKVKVESYLDEIRKPAGDEDHTEIYSSLTAAAESFRNIKGRKVLIILSDGENEYYSDFEKKNHPVWGKKKFTPKEAVYASLEEGISVFSINFGVGQMKDKNLGKISLETGGAIFDAEDEVALNDIYSVIVNQVLNEYLVSFKATMDPADIKHVRVQHTSDGISKDSVRYYFSSTVFGMPGNIPLVFMLLPLLIAAALLWLISKLDFRKKKTPPSLEVLGSDKTVVFENSKSAKTQVLSQSAKTIISIDGAKTVISTGETKQQGDNVTIVFDNNRKAFTVVSTTPILVNNKTLKTKVLQSGDVIEINGKTIVFDEGVKE